ncbi:Hypothetical protein (Fragment), partial [Durusdinium trenchii]
MLVQFADLLLPFIMSLILVTVLEPVKQARARAAACTFLLIFSKLPCCRCCLKTHIKYLTEFVRRCWATGNPSREGVGYRLLEVFPIYFPGEKIDLSGGAGMPQPPTGSGGRSSVVGRLVGKVMVLTILLAFRIFWFVGQIVWLSGEAVMHDFKFYKMGVGKRTSQAMGPCGRFHLEKSIPTDMKHMGDFALSLLQYVAQFLSQQVFYTLTQVSLTAIFVLFLLFSPVQRDFSPVMQGVFESMELYLKLKTFISAMMGVTNGIALAVIGLELPAAWGLLTFLANFIPNIGGPVVSIVPCVISLLDARKSLTQVTMAFFVQFFLHFNIANFVEPMVFGSSEDARCWYAVGEADFGSGSGVVGLPSPEVRISYATPTVLASPVTAPIFVKTPDTVSGRSTPMAMAFQPTQALAPAVQKVSTPRCAEAPKVKAPEVEVPQPDLPGPPAEVSPRERSKTPKTPRTPRSLQNSLSQPAVGGHLPGRIQGISCCALCHSLLQIFAGKVRIQTFANSSELPAPPARLVDRALAYELSEADDVAASDTFCRLHHLHKNRYELWLKGQDAIRRCTARGDAQATRVIRSCAEEMGKLDNICGKVEQEYLEAFASFFKQLQQDVRENLFKTLMGKADELVNAWQHEIEEVNQQIDKKVQQKRHNLQTAVHRRHEAAKEDFWRQHEKQCAQQFVSCLVDNCRNMHIGRAMDASTAFKELELSQQARRPATEKSVEGKAQSRADQERAKRRIGLNDRRSNEKGGEEEEMESVVVAQDRLSEAWNGSR